MELFGRQALEVVGLLLAQSLPMEVYGSLGAGLLREEIPWHIPMMESTGRTLLLDTRFFQDTAQPSLRMEAYGSRLEMGGLIGSHIPPMESTGYPIFLEMGYLRPHVIQLLQMARYGSREAQEQISLCIHLMESTGLRPLLGMGY